MPVAAPTRHIFGSGGNNPNVLAAVGRLSAFASRGSAPPPEPGLLEGLCRDRERRASVAVDQLSFVASPNGFLTAARAATVLEAVAAEAASSVRPSGDQDNVIPTNAAGKGGATVAAVARPSAPLLLRPSVSTSVHVNVGEFHSLLSLKSRPLASLSVTGLGFEASRNEWWELGNTNSNIFDDPGAKTAKRSTAWVDTPSASRPDRPRRSAGVDLERSTPTVGWPGWVWTGGRHRVALGYLRVSLQGLEVLDLTTDGQLHNQVISHDGARGPVAAPPAAAQAASGGIPAADSRESAGRSSRAHEAATKEAAAAAVAERLPVIVVELIPGNARHNGGKEVNASVRGLRVCFLHRFVAEVTKYFGPDRLGPVFAVVRRFGGGGVEAADAAGSEADDESVAVVMREEDQTVPDKWSVAGSDEGHDGNSRVGQDGDENDRAKPGSMPRLGEEEGAGGGEAGGSGAGMRVTAMLQDLTVVVPRSTHSREAAAVKCEELVLEVSFVRPATCLCLLPSCQACVPNTTVGCPTDEQQWL